MEFTVRFVDFQISFRERFKNEGVRWGRKTKTAHGTLRSAGGRITLITTINFSSRPQQNIRSTSPLPS